MNIFFYKIMTTRPRTISGEHLLKAKRTYKAKIKVKAGHVGKAEIILAFIMSYTMLNSSINVT